MDFVKHPNPDYEPPYLPDPQNPIVTTCTVDESVGGEERDEPICSVCGMADCPDDHNHPLGYSVKELYEPYRFDPHEALVELRRLVLCHPPDRTRIVGKLDLLRAYITGMER